MKDILTKYVLTRSFALGAIITIGIFSKYIFGDDNFLEQAMEFLTTIFTGANVDFS